MAYRRIEQYDDHITKQLAECYKTIIASAGEDVGREGLLKTPERAAKAFQFSTQGYGQDAVEILNSARFKEEISEMV
ncbi:MAG TPA: GTP cyclohydrolase I, partial [Flavisolibacter sp.]|nr:GTP cyclohydrolase I [Flavisolibacter sp.]